MEIQRSGVDVQALGLIDAGWELDQNQWGDITTKVFAVSGPKIYGFSRGLQNEVMNSDADLLHLHALWMHTSVIASQWGGYTKRPYIVTPNGMLEPWALRNSGWKKQVAALLYENKMLHGATCLQANTEKELADFRAYGLRNPIAIIPNGVDLPDFTESSDEGRGSRAIEAGSDSRVEGRESTPRTLLFLGRIHPKKGLSSALRAFKKALDDRPSTLDSPWQFVIAGWDQGGHEAELMKLCEELGLKSEKFRNGCEATAGSAKVESEKVRKFDSEVVFWGAAFGREKDALLRSADAFILPSFSEGLPMSVLEAWAYRLPVVMTPECNLPEGFAAEAGIRIETDVPSIARGLDTLFSMSDADLCSMGTRGYELVKQRFTWRTVAEQMRSVYDWMLGGGSPPECVRMD